MEIFNWLTFGEEIKKGDVYGDGDVFGNGSGNGFGYGLGNGYGNENGHGYGFGYGNGYGEGYGYGYQHEFGYKDLKENLSLIFTWLTFGNGYDFGYGCRNGNGHGFGYGYGNGKGNGYGYGDWHKYGNECEYGYGDYFGAEYGVGYGKSKTDLSQIFDWLTFGNGGCYLYNYGHKDVNNCGYTYGYGYEYGNKFGYGYGCGYDMYGNGYGNGYGDPYMCEKPKEDLSLIFDWLNYGNFQYTDPMIVYDWGDIRERGKGNFDCLGDYIWCNNEYNKYNKYFFPRRRNRKSIRMIEIFSWLNHGNFIVNNVISQEHYPKFNDIDHYGLNYHNYYNVSFPCSYRGIYYDLDEPYLIDIFHWLTYGWKIDTSNFIERREPLHNRSFYNIHDWYTRIGHPNNFVIFIVIFNIYDMIEIFTWLTWGKGHGFRYENGYGNGLGYGFEEGYGYGDGTGYGDGYGYRDGYGMAYGYANGRIKENLISMFNWLTFGNHIWGNRWENIVCPNYVRAHDNYGCYPGPPVINKQQCRVHGNYVNWILNLFE